MLKYVVCDPTSKDCMLQQCADCPDNTNGLRNHLMSIINELDYGETIEFSQWVTTDRATLINKTDYHNDYINTVVTQLKKLSSFLNFF